MTMKKSSLFKWGLVHNTLLNKKKIGKPLFLYKLLFNKKLTINNDN